MDHYDVGKEVVQKLVHAGFIAYFAGGWVRDYVMQHPSHDIDIATNAPPNQIMDLFPKTVLVGLSFGVVIVLHQGHQFEVSSFRKDISYSDGRRPDRIEFSSPEEDAKRRDFTINGMFYDPLENRIHDYVGGYEDIQHRIIRTIGDPNERFLEDRLRMIRAVRFAARFDFSIHPNTEQAIWENADTLYPAVAKERVWQELEKMRKTPLFDRAIIDLHRLNLLATIFPILQNTHLKDLRSRIAPFSRMPQEAPTTLFFIHLFPDQSLDEVLDIGRSLRVKNRDLKWIEAYYQTRIFLAQPQERLEPYEWACFYASPYHGLCLKVYATTLPEQEAQTLFTTHEARKSKLYPHIQRIEKKSPIVNSKDLKAEGIPPGIWMGRLLKEAERLSVNHNFRSKKEVLEALKKYSEDWTKR